MTNHPLHTFPYPQPIIITSVAFWQALLMHRFQNTVSQTQYPKNKEGVPLILPHAVFKHGLMWQELDTLPKHHTSGY